MKLPGRHTPRAGVGGLYVDLIPSSSWFTNARSALTSREWDTVRRAVYAKAGYRCEVCGGQGERHPVEAHERWVYDDVDDVQELVRLVALCPACHEVTHFGLARVRGRGDDALAHLMAVNGWTRDEALDHIDEAFALQDERSKVRWTLDLSHLRDYGVEPPRQSAQRRGRLGRGPDTSPMTWDERAPMADVLREPADDDAVRVRQAVARARWETMQECADTVVTMTLRASPREFRAAVAALRRAERLYRAALAVAEGVAVSGTEVAA